MSRVLSSVWILALAAAAAGAAAPQSLAPGVAFETFSGWENCLALRGGDCKVVVLPAVGGRVAAFALNGDNILYDEPGSGGKLLADHPAGFAMGGSAFDVGPESRGLPEHLRLWLGPWNWQTPRPQTVALESLPEPALGVQMSREIVVDPDTGEVGLVQRLKNVSSNEVSCSLWDRTVCKAGGFALLPLSKKSRFKAGWSLAAKGAGGTVRYEAGDPADRRVRVMDGILVVEAGGAALKVGVDADQEWIAYAVGRLLFVKYFPHSPSGNYPDGGNTAAFSAEPLRATLEVLGPEARLRPGQSALLPEKWVLLDLEKPAGSASDARALAKRIPPSPFRK